MPQLRKARQGFTLVQLLIVLFIIAILVTIAIPNVADYNRRSRGLSCATNLRTIQLAKDAWERDYPNWEERPSIPQAELVKYLTVPIPHCAGGGGYLNVLTPGVPVSCTLNGGFNYEPAGDTNPQKNGYHDLSSP